MRNRRNILALCLCASLGFSMVACGQEDNIMSDVAEEDLDYGATMREAKSIYAVPVTYDRRYLDEEMLTVICNFMASIQNADAELYVASTLDFYAAYQLSDVYSESYSTMEEIAQALHDSIGDNTAEDFTFSMITISDFTTERIVSGIDTMIEILDNLNGDDDFSETVDQAWAVTMEWMLSYDDTTTIVDDQILFLLLIDGEYYCVM